MNDSNQTIHEVSDMRTGRIFGLIIGCLLLVPSLGLLIGGSALGIAAALGRDDDGYFNVTIDEITTPTAAVTSGSADLMTEPGEPDWAIDRLDADVRLRVTPLATDRNVFVGIAETRFVEAYLGGVEHDEIADIDDGRPVYERRLGDVGADPPIDQEFWVAAAWGTAMQEITWEATSGRWTAVVMNADGSVGVAADVQVGAKTGIVVPLAIILGIAGLVLTAVAVALISVGAHRPRADRALPPPTPDGRFPLDGVPADVDADDTMREPHPVTLSASIDPALSRWLWLVKWLLAIPHFIALIVLWIGFFVTTIVAGFAILITGRYPRGLFEFNVGVLRWTWRVSHYATNGGLGTDRYPPFALGPRDDDAAALEIEYPERLSRGLVLVKWWLLAIPHYLVLALLFGTFSWNADGEPNGAGSLVTLLSIVAGVILLVRGSLSRPLFGLIVGFNRWMYRVIAYAALMTDRYPPFRLDQGGAEPTTRRPPTSPPEPELGSATDAAPATDHDVERRDDALV